MDRKDAAAEGLRARKADALDRIFMVLYETESGAIDPEKAWYSETIELVADIVRQVRDPHNEA
jgi:hypothetical protein